MAQAFPDQPESNQPEPAAPRRKRFILWRVFMLGGARRRHRWVVRFLAAVVLFLAIALVVLTHSPVTKWLILPKLEKASGLNVDADWIHIGRTGRVVIDHVRVTIPSLPGEEGRVFKAARVTAGVAWTSLFSGTPRLTGVEVVDPVLVVSQSTDDDTLNIAAITPPSTSGRPSMEVPNVTVHNLSLELAEHGKSGFHILKRIPMDGDLTPVPDQKDDYAVHLQETTVRRVPAGEKAGPGFNLDGIVGASGIKLNLVNFSLTDWPASTLLPSVRKISGEMDLKGQVSSAEFSFTKPDNIMARVNLKGVAMSLPIEAEVEGPVRPPEDPNAPPATNPLRMTNVNGSIVFAKNSVEAKVTGVIADLPYKVTLKYGGVDANSPFDLDFEAQDFTLDKHPQLLLYADPKVKFYLNQVFMRPTGIISTRVTVKRGPAVKRDKDLPEEDGPITVSGSLDFHDGTCAYEGFPYEFEHMSGRFEFDNDSIRIVRVAGVSPTGAKLLSHGEVSPLDDSSEVTIFVDVTDARIDEAMEAAFGPERSQVLKALFSETRYKELLDAGLIRTPEQAKAEAGELANLIAAGADADQGRIAHLRERQQVREFSFGGTADVNVRIHSPRGVNVPYVTNVDIRLPKVGLLPEKFPLPVVAEDVFVEIRNTDGKLTMGTFHGLNGGRAQVGATFNVPKKTDTDPQSRPQVDIDVTDMPFDDLMIHALPSADGTIKKVIAGLGVYALGSGTVHIGPRQSPGGGGDADLGFDADIEIKSGEARPHPFLGSGVVAISDFTGHLDANENKLFLDLDGTPVLVPPVEPGAEGPPTPLMHAKHAGGTFTAHIRGEFPPEQAGKPAEPSSFFLAAHCPAFDLSAPVESIVSVFSEKAAEALVKMRSEQKPSGFVDMRTQVDSGGGDVPTTVEVELSKGRTLAADVMGSRLLMPESSGKVLLTRGADSRTIVTFDAVSGMVLFGDQPGGTAALDGPLVIDGPGVFTDAPLEVTLLDARYEANLTRTVLEQQLGADAADLYKTYSPTGIFDATLAVRRASVQGGGGLMIQGLVEPRTLALKIGDLAVPFNTVSGALEFEPGNGVLRELSIFAPDWEARVNGGWAVGSDGRVQVRTEISGRGGKVTDDLLAILPAELRSVLDDLKLKVNGPFRLSDSALDLSRGGAPADRSTIFNGRFDFAGTSLEAGVPITDAVGSVLARYENAAGKQSFHLDTRAQRFAVEGVTLLDGRAVVESGRTPGQVRVPEASGVAHRGRFALTADVTPINAQPNAPKDFHVDLRMAGLRFNTLLRELIDAVKPFVGPEAPPETDPTPATLANQGEVKDEFSRGLLDGEFTLTGRVGDPATRLGRGMIRICGGRVVNLPVVTALIEASNLQFPMNASLDFAQTKFYLEGGLITLEDMSVQSRSIEIVGKGTMTFPEKEVDLRFISRAARPIPILSDIVEAFRNELIVTMVRGKLGDLSVGLQAPGPTRMLDPFGGSQSKQAQAQADLERRSAAARERDRQSDRGIRPVVESAAPTDR